MAWTFPTLAETEGLEGAECPCGRRTTTDMISDLRSMPAAKRAAFGVRELACDACREAAFRRGVDRVDFFAALGAPQEILDRVKAFVQKLRR